MMHSSLLKSQIQARYEEVLTRIDRAAWSVGRNSGEVRLVVVTKSHPLETVKAAIEAGAQSLGENYAEEGVEKIEKLVEVGVDPSGVEWHMIGHVQSRKAALIAEHFDLIHSLDSVKLAKRLNRFAAGNGRTLPALLQLNVSGEKSKSGLPAWDVNHQTLLIEMITQILDCPHIEIQGLMTIPPFFENPELSRPYFQKLREWQEFFTKTLHQTDWNTLSMGMSDDFEVAVQEGATLVRIGTAILGPRI
jgi:PLP dependent protein